MLWHDQRVHVKSCRIQTIKVTNFPEYKTVLGHTDTVVLVHLQSTKLNPMKIVVRIELPLDYS